MAYADYTYYKNMFCGTRLTESEFNHYVIAASAYVDAFLFYRLSSGAEVTNNVKNAVCAVAEVEKAESVQVGETSAAIRSETVDGDSVTYATAQEIAFAWNREKRSLIELYIPANSPLRRRWV